MEYVLKISTGMCVLFWGLNLDQFYFIGLLETVLLLGCFNPILDGIGDTPIMDGGSPSLRLMTT